jgi:hypothetical protein
VIRIAAYDLMFNIRHARLGSQCCCRFRGPCGAVGSSRRRSRRKEGYTGRLHVPEHIGETRGSGQLVHEVFPGIE